MRSTELGIGVPGALGADAIADLAALAEQVGYRSFWFNCVAPHADPAALLDAALSATERIAIGTGVVPLNGYPAPALATQLAGGAADDPRVILGIGSGAGRRGALVRVIDGITVIRNALPRARVVIGGKGPRMLTIGASVADGLLLSMMSLADAVDITSHLASARRDHATTYAYHRVALDPGAADRVHAEMTSHGVWPANGQPPRAEQLIGTVVPSADAAHDTLLADLARYPDDWVPVLRPLPGRPDELDDWRALLRLFAPR
jgi:alkanesulfonate monooxygenase SsuD/methylene tetrahydromethanopterin reductase-like flavin-dependent oxidoreductase (luciferase family)